MSTSHVREMINISREMVSLDAEVSGTDSNKANVADFQEDTINARPDEKVIESSMSHDINRVLDTLKPNESRVIRMRYGLNGAKPMSLKEVGEHCDLTKERIRQIEKTAITRLQHPTRARRLVDYAVA